MKKLLMILLVAVMITTNTQKVDAKTFYYEPTHIVKELESKGYTFNIPSFENNNVFYEKGYKQIGKKFEYHNTLGYLRSIANAYDLDKNVSESKEFFNVADKDFESLCMEFEVDFGNLQEMFIESFMLYCINEDEFKAVCPNLHSYIKNTVMPFVFTDVTEKAWYRPCVEEAYYLGLMTGATETLFKPNSNMTRGMVATVLHRIERSEHMEYFPFFSDLENNQYYTEAVIWCYSTGIIKGYGDCTFRPNKNITREEMAIMLCNFAKYKGAYKQAAASLTSFKDYKDVSSYATESMKWAVENCLISGKDNGTRLDPNGATTRAEASKMLCNLYYLIY